jgi:hypothetical protein
LNQLRLGVRPASVNPQQHPRDLPFVALLALLAPFWRRGRAGVIPVLLIGTHLVVFWNVSPVVSYFHRFLVPLVPFAVLLAVIALDELPRRASQTWARTALRAVPVVGVLVWALSNPFTGVRSAQGRMGRLEQRMAGRMKVADFLHARLTEDATVAIGDVGMVGYLLVNPILDAFGLNSREFADSSQYERLDYWESIPVRAPDAIVLASRAAAEFRPKYLFGTIMGKSRDFSRDYAERAARIGAGGRYVYWVHLHSKTSAVRKPPGARHFGDVCREDIVGCVEPLRRRLGGS